MFALGKLSDKYWSLCKELIVSNSPGFLVDVHFEGEALEVAAVDVDRLRERELVPPTRGHGNHLGELNAVLLDDNVNFDRCRLHVPLMLSDWRIVAIWRLRPSICSRK